MVPRKNVLNIYNFLNFFYHFDAGSCFLTHKINVYVYQIFKYPNFVLHFSFVITYIFMSYFENEQIKKISEL